MINEDWPVLLICLDLERPQLDVLLNLIVAKLIADHSFCIIECALWSSNQLTLGRCADELAAILLLVVDHRRCGSAALLILGDLATHRLTCCEENGYGRVGGPQVDSNDLLWNLFLSLDHIWLIRV